MSEAGTSSSQDSETMRAHVFDEYKEASLNWRYYGEVRFKQLTVFLTATGALGAALFSKASEANPSKVKPFIVFLGLAITAAFFVLEERATYYRRAYMYILRSLEGHLEFRQYACTRNPLILRSRFVYRGVFSIIAGIWLYLDCPLDPPVETETIVLWSSVILLVGAVLHVICEYYQRLAVDSPNRFLSSAPTGPILPWLAQLRSKHRKWLID
jgi:hypothetical protein